MKQIIRLNTFETNSSSIHALCYSKEEIVEETKLQGKVYLNDYDNCFDILDTPLEKLSYLYTYASSRHLLYGLQNILELFPYVKFQPIKYDEYGDVIYGYIGHGCFGDYKDSITMESMLSDKETIKQIIFNGIIIISSDGCCQNGYIEDIVDEYKNKHQNVIVSWKGN